MRDIFKMMACIAAMLSCIIVPTSCSDDNPDPDTWRKDLFSVNELVCHPGSIVGWYDEYELGLHIYLQDNNKRPLLEGTDSATESDWYIEYENQKYFLGDTIPVTGNKEPISVKRYQEAVTVIMPVNVDWHILQESSPVRFSYTFAWPSKNIRKKMDYYAEYNVNYPEQRQTLLETLSPPNSGLVEIYKAGCWVEGKSIGNKTRIYYLTVD